MQFCVDDARSQKVERVICLGDIVGYGPQPAEALALVRSLGAITIAGNHDDAVCGRLDTKDFNPLAANAVERHKKQLSPEALDFLRSLPYTYRLSATVSASHGDFIAPEEFGYIENADDARLNFAACEAKLMFVGHTHIPAAFAMEPDGRVYAMPDGDFTLEPGKRYIVNPGSVGYPREAHGMCISTYAIYDTEARKIEFRSLPFLVESVMQRGNGGKPLRPLFFLTREFVSTVLALLVFAFLGWFLWHDIHSSSFADEYASWQNSDESSFPAPDSPGAIVKTLNLSAKENIVRPNLELGAISDPTVLYVSFHFAKGRDRALAPQKVLTKCNKSIKIPKGAVKATFTLVPIVEGYRVHVAVFEPFAETKTPARGKKKKNADAADGETPPPASSPKKRPSKAPKKSASGDLHISP